MFQLTIEDKIFHLFVLDFARLCHPNIPFDMKKMRGDIACHIRQGTFFTKARTKMSLNEDTEGNDENNSDENDDDEFKTTDTHDMLANSRSNSYEKNPFDYINDDDDE